MWENCSDFDPVAESKLKEPLTVLHGLHCAMADLCRAYSGLSDALVERDRPNLRAAILRRVAGELRAIAGTIEDEAVLQVPPPSSPV